jgi:hypothetical protein
LLRRIDALDTDALRNRLDALALQTPRFRTMPT